MSTSKQDWPADPDKAAFQGLAGEIVKAIEPNTESDSVALLAQILVAFGILVGRGPHYLVEGDEHHGNLFLLIVGKTAKGRKGTSWGRVRQIFSQVPDWPRVVDGLSTGEGIKFHVRDGSAQSGIKVKGKSVETPSDPGIADKRLLIMEPEFSSVLRQGARQGNTLTATIRCGWDSGNLQTLTKNDPVVATGAHIGIIGHITDVELRRELSATDSSNGYANRFLFIVAKRSKLLPHGGDGLTPICLEGFVERITVAAETARSRGRVEMTPEAKSAWTAAYTDLSEGSPGLFGAVTGRAEAQCIRLSLLYALLDRSPAIELRHLQAAFAFWKRCADSARFIFGSASGDPVAEQILNALLAVRPSALTRTKISNCLGRKQPSTRIDDALALLEQRGLAECRVASTGGANANLWVAK